MAAADDSPTIIISNETICSLRAEAKSDEACLEIFLSKPELSVSFLECNRDSLRKKIGDTFRRLAALRKKNNKKKTSEFLSQPFTAPVKLEPSTSGALKRKLCQEERKTAALTSELNEKKATLKTTLESINEIQEVVKVQSEQRLNAEVRLSEVVEQNKCLQEKISNFSTRNVNKRLKRRDEKILNLEEKNAKLESEKKDIENKLIALQTAKVRLNTKRKEVARLKEKIKDKVEQSKLASYSLAEIEAISCEKDKEIAELQKAVDFLSDDGAKIETKSGNAYTHNVREVCIELMCRLNVSIKKIPDVIRLVMDKLANRTVQDLPSQATLSRLFTEANIIAKTHVANELLKQADETGMTGATLHGDATTKYSTHVQGMQTTLPDGQQLTMCLEEVASGDAQAYFRVFEDAVEDLAQFSSLPAAEARAKIISSFKSFMNDQCAVNGVLTKKIEDLRRDVLPSVLDYSSMSPDDIKKAESMGHFACRMHLLANFATAADKGVLAYEEAVSSGENPHSFSTEDQSGTLRLIRTSAKALTKRGCDKSGVNAYFESFLTEQGRTNKLITYLGHRFNVMFVDAAALYYHKEDVSTFLSLMPDPNRLLKSVAWDLKEKVYEGGLRALGLLSKFIMEPFHKLLLADHSILEINADLAALQKQLAEWSQDGSSLLTGKYIFDPKYYPDEDQVRDALLQDTADCDLDCLTQVATELICGELLLLFERQTETQLPGGRYADPSAEELNCYQNVQPHNLLSERDMACYDNLLKVKPGAAAQTLEATIMWQNNKTGTWLGSLPQKDKEKVFADAKKKKAAYKQKVQVRIEELKRQKLERLKAKQKKKSTQEDNAIESRLKAIRGVKTYGGMWEKDEVDRKVEEFLDEDDLRLALLAQIKYQKMVVKAKGPRQLFQASSQGQQFSVELLLHNLKEIHSIQATSQSSGSTETVLARNKDFEGEAAKRKVELVQRLTEARRKRENQQQVRNMLPAYLLNPEDLIGKSFHHQCREDGEVQWFRGRVESIRKRHKEAEKTEYNIRYDLFSDDEWHFPLLIDLKKGDLVLDL